MLSASILILGLLYIHELRILGLPVCLLLRPVSILVLLLFCLLLFVECQLLSCCPECLLPLRLVLFGWCKILEVLVSLLLLLKLLYHFWNRVLRKVRVFSQHFITLLPHILRAADKVKVVSKYILCSFRCPFRLRQLPLILVDVEVRTDVFSSYFWQLFTPLFLL